MGLCAMSGNPVSFGEKNSFLLELHSPGTVSWCDFGVVHTPTFPSSLS